MLQIGIELTLAILVVVFQLTFFTRTRTKIADLADFFPRKDWSGDDIVTINTATSQARVIDDEELNGPFLDMVESVNRFLTKNSGAADFGVIRNIVDRRIDAIENNITSTITLPLYTGLMGTFVGIITGLVVIAFGKDLDMDKDINGLLGGVVIAMGASFIGLLLTVYNNSHHFKMAKGKCDQDKIAFFDFLQEDLMPYLGNSLYDALDNLKGNINAFNTTFQDNIKLFDVTFSTNIGSLKDSVASLSGNMDALITNTRTQQEFIQEIKKLGQLHIARTNTEVYKVLTELIPHLLAFQEQQQKLNETVRDAGAAAESIGRIMDRLKNFESGIQKLGDVIDNRKFLGNEIIERVDKNLKNLNRDYDLLKDYELTTTEQLQQHFNAQYQQVKRLTDQIKDEVEEALNFNTAQNPLKKLLLLDSLDKHLAEINDKLTNRETVITPLVPPSPEDQKPPVDPPGREQVELPAPLPPKQTVVIEDDPFEEKKGDDDDDDDDEVPFKPSSQDDRSWFQKMFGNK